MSLGPKDLETDSALRSMTFGCGGVLNSLPFNQKVRVKVQKIKNDGYDGRGRYLHGALRE